MKKPGKLNILVVSESDKISGITRYIESLTKFLEKEKYNVFLIHGKINKTSGLKFKAQVIKSYQLKSQSSFVKYYFQIITQTFKAFSAIQSSRKINVIHYHHTASALGIILNRKSFKIPKIFHFHGPWFLEFKSSIKQPKKHKMLGKISRFFKYFLLIFLLKKLQGYCLEKSQCIIAPNQFSKHNLIKYFKIDPDKIIIEPNCVDFEIFHPVPNKLNKKPIFTNRQVLLVASRFEPRKGIQNAILSLPEIKKNFPEILLVISFPKTETLNLEYTEYINLVNKLNLAKSVIFVANLAKNGLCRYYNSAQLTIIPSVELENCPLVALESLACSTPVIASKSGGLAEILKPVAKNLLINKSSPKLIANSVIRYLKLENRYKKLIRKKCFDYCQQKFNWSININKITSIYEKISKI